MGLSGSILIILLLAFVVFLNSVHGLEYLLKKGPRGFFYVRSILIFRGSSLVQESELKAGRDISFLESDLESCIVRIGAIDDYLQKTDNRDTRRSLVLQAKCKACLGYFADAVDPLHKAKKLPEMEEWDRLQDVVSNSDIDHMINVWSPKID